MSHFQNNSPGNTTRLSSSVLSKETQAALSAALSAAAREIANKTLLPAFRDDIDKILASRTLTEVLRESGIIAEWEARGKIEGVRETILLFGRKRFGEPEGEIVQALEAISSAETLQQLAERLLEAESWEELIVPSD
jgi:hypothetical protein